MTFINKAQQSIKKFFVAYENRDISWRTVAVLFVFFEWMTFSNSHNIGTLLPSSIAEKYDTSYFLYWVGYAFAFLGLIPYKGRSLNQRIASVLSFMVTYSLLSRAIDFMNSFSYVVLVVLVFFAQPIIGYVEGKPLRNTRKAPELVVRATDDTVRLRHPFLTFVSVAFFFLLGGYSLTSLIVILRYSGLLIGFDLIFIAEALFSILLMNSLYSLGYKIGRAEKIESEQYIVCLFDLIYAFSALYCYYAVMTIPLI